MYTFDKRILINNIYYLTKQKNIKIGDLENESQVSAGYFSRLAKDDNNSVPSIETMYMVSKILDISLDVLINYEYEILSETEQYLVTFLGKLIKETLENKICWHRESLIDIKNNWISQGQTLDSNHPLMIVVEDEFESDNTLKYNSLFVDYFLDLRNDVFWFKNFQTKFYIAKVEHYKDIRNLKAANNMESVYEMYTVTEGHRNKVCNATSETNSVINKLMINLYDGISLYCKKPKIADEVKLAIDCFMKGLNPNDKSTK